MQHGAEQRKRNQQEILDQIEHKQAQHRDIENEKYIEKQNMQLYNKVEREMARRKKEALIQKHRARGVPERYIKEFEKVKIV